MSNTAGGAISKSAADRRASRGPLPLAGASLMQRTAAGKSSSESQLELLSSTERTLDALAQLPDLLADVGVRRVAAAAHLQQLVRQVQRGHHRDAVQADDAAGIADLAHLAVQELGGVEQLGALLGQAGDLVFLFED